MTRFTGAPSFNIDVSIHTPTKGVTALNTDAFTRIRVSIHTPTKGVTAMTYGYAPRYAGFNPHTHEGCDLILKVLLLHLVVSIHTPTKGVTAAFGGTPFRLKFQSTHPRRV